MKIDIVYLWVDGDDPKMRAKRNAALAAIGRPVSKFAAGASRWRDNDELKYSLRSVRKFAPWINRIFIVTDGQRPEWLADPSSQSDAEAGDPRITIVDHRDIIPEKYLPVFNSTAIEIFIHNIPNLSEHFLFANDDMMFTAPVTPDFFFDANENPIVIVQEKWWSRSIYCADQYHVGGHDKIFNNMFINGLRLAYKKTCRRYGVWIAHAVEPMRKSYLTEIIDENLDEFARTSVTPFRDVNNIQRIAYPLINHARGRTTLTLKRRPFGHRVKYNGKFPLLWHAVMLLGDLFGFARTDVVDSPRNVVAKIKRRKPALICIRDSDNANEMRAAKKYFDEILPDKAVWEK